MASDTIIKPVIDELLASDAGNKLTKIIETITTVQQGMHALAESDQTELQKIGTVIQVFFLETFASGRTPGSLTQDEWKAVAEKMYQYAVMEDGQGYSEYIFTLYARFIDLSAEGYQLKIGEKNYESIKGLADTIRQNTQLLKEAKIKETDYIEACLWLSLEAMIKLLSATITSGLGTESAELVQAASQLAFEYGRYVLFKKEQALLEKYIQNQHVLDEQLKAEYEAYLEEVSEQADRFQKLVEDAFSPNLHESLLQSAALAREAGVKEEEILTSIEDIDDFFL